MSDNKNVPEIRFKGFSEPLKSFPLIELSENNLSNGVFNDAKLVGSGYKLINVKDMYSGDEIEIKNLTLLNIRESEFKKNQVKYGDIFFTRSSIVPSGIAYSNVNLSKDDNLTFDGHLMKMSPVQELIDPYYLSVKFKTKTLRKRFISRGKQSTMSTIGQGDIADIVVEIPSKTEQQKIGNYFQNVDKLITQNQSKHNLLVNLKKAMLEKMFPREGCNIPEIRFEGFNEAWEEKRLGDIGNTFTGLSGKTKDDFGHGNGRFITYTNIFANPISNRNLNEPIEVDNTQNQVQFGDVFFTTSSEIPEEVGMSSVWLENCEDTYLNSFCFGYRPTKKFDNYYLAYFLRSLNFRKNMIFLAQGISRYNISKNKVMDIVIMIPSMKEQQKIGSYFQNLDKLIALQKQQLEKLKNLKKACLDKMFV